MKKIEVLRNRAVIQNGMEIVRAGVVAELLGREDDKVIIRNPDTGNPVRLDEDNVREVQPDAEVTKPPDLPTRFE